MTRKSAAQVKVKKQEQEPQPAELPIEEQFEQAHQVMDALIETQLSLVYRPDTIFDIKAEAKDKGLELDFFTASDIQASLRKLYAQMQERINAWTLEQFSVESMDDPFGDLYTYTDKLGLDKDEQENWLRNFEQLIKFEAVRPYAEKASQLHQLVLEHKEDQDA